MIAPASSAARACDKELRRRKWPRYVRSAVRDPLPETMFHMQYAKNKLPASTIAILTNGDFLDIDLYDFLIIIAARITQITH